MLITVKRVNFNFYFRSFLCFCYAYVMIDEIPDMFLFSLLCWFDFI